MNFVKMCLKNVSFRIYTGSRENMFIDISLYLKYCEFSWTFLYIILFYKVKK